MPADGLGMRLARLAVCFGAAFAADRAETEQTERATPEPLFRTLKEVQSILWTAKTAYPRCAPPAAPGSHDDLDLLGAAPATYRLLRDLRVLIIGDSVAKQFADSMRRTLRTDVTKTSITYFRLCTIPHRARRLTALLKREVTGLRQADVVVFDIGIWYNFAQTGGGAGASVDTVSSNHTAYMVGCSLREVYKACGGRAFPRAVYERMSTEKGWERNACLRKIVLCSLVPGIPPTSYDWARRAAGTCGKAEYVSDLKRLKESILMLRAASGIAKLPLLIWMAIPPQHFPTDSGMFENFSGQDSCVPIRNLTAAYGRNAVASRILAPLFADGTLHLMNRSWEQTAKLYNSHRRGDCTHFCLASPVPRLWIQDLTQTIHTAKSGDGRPASQEPGV